MLHVFIWPNYTLMFHNLDFPEIKIFPLPSSTAPAAGAGGSPGPPKLGRRTVRQVELSSLLDKRFWYRGITSTWYPALKGSCLLQQPSNIGVRGRARLAELLEQGLQVLPFSSVTLPLAQDWATAHWRSLRKFHLEGMGAFPGLDLPRLKLQQHRRQLQQCWPRVGLRSHSDTPVLLSSTTLKPPNLEQTNSEGVSLAELTSLRTHSLWDWPKPRGAVRDSFQMLPVQRTQPTGLPGTSASMDPSPVGSSNYQNSEKKKNVSSPKKLILSQPKRAQKTIIFV